MYDNWLTSGHLDGQYRDYSYFHPSDLGYCIRKAVLMKLDFPGRFYVMPRLQRIFENGHSTHARFQEHLGKMGVLYGNWICSNCEKVLGKESRIGIPRPSNCHYCKNPKTREVFDNKGNRIWGPEPIFHYKELRVENSVMDVKGHSDGVINIKGTNHVVDFKTCSQAAFNDVKIRNQPMEAHVFQINIYMYILQVDYGLLVYENRNDLRIKEFLLKKDPAVLKEVINRIKVAKAALENNTVPEIPLGLTDTSFACAGYPGCPPCPFFYHCHPAAAERAMQFEAKYQDFVQVDKQLEGDD